MAAWGPNNVCKLAGHGCTLWRPPRPCLRRRRVGLHTAIKPLISHSTTGEFNSPPKYVRIPHVRVELPGRAPHGH
eukprot:3710173-Pyramimonas_sp.AAC.1